MIGKPINYQTFANGFKFWSRTYLIEELYEVKIKCLSLICLIDIDLSVLNCIELQNRTSDLPVLSIKAAYSVTVNIFRKFLFSF